MASYIDALIKEKQFDEAGQTIADAKQAGIPTAKLQIFEEQLQSELSPGSDIPQQEISNPLHSHHGELSAAIELREVGKYKEAQEWLSNLIEHDSRNSEALSLPSQVFLLDKKGLEAERALKCNRRQRERERLCRDIYWRQWDNRAMQSLPQICTRKLHERIHSDCP